MLGFMGIRDLDELKLIWWLVFKLELAPVLVVSKNTSSKGTFFNLDL